MAFGLVALVLIMLVSAVIGIAVVKWLFNDKPFGIKLLTFGVIFWVTVFLQGVIYAVAIHPFIN